MTVSRADWRSGATVPGLRSELFPNAVTAAAEMAAQAAPREDPEDNAMGFDADRRSVEIVSTVSSSSAVMADDTLPLVIQAIEASEEAKKDEQPPIEVEASPRPRSNRSETSDDA